MKATLLIDLIAAAQDWADERRVPDEIVDELVAAALKYHGLLDL